MEQKWEMLGQNVGMGLEESWADNDLSDGSSQIPSYHFPVTTSLIKQFVAIEIERYYLPTISIVVVVMKASCRKLVDGGSAKF